jgi:hypothetical protein
LLLREEKNFALQRFLSWLSGWLLTQWRLENSIASVTAPSSESDIPGTVDGTADDGGGAERQPPGSLYSQLDADKVLETLRALHARIAERFPDRGLNEVCAELEAICSRSRERIQWIARPNWPLRITRYLLVGIIVIGVVATVVSLKPPVDAAAMTLVEFIQILEAGINDVVLITIGVFLSGRWKHESSAGGRWLHCTNCVRLLTSLICIS